MTFILFKSKKKHHYSLCLVVSIDVDDEADVDGEDGEEDAGEGHAGELVNELDADEDDAAHHDEGDGAVHAEVVELDEVVSDVRAEQRHARTDQVRLQGRGR